MNKNFLLTVARIIGAGLGRILAAVIFLFAIFGFLFLTGLLVKSCGIQLAVNQTIGETCLEGFLSFYGVVMLTMFGDVIISFFRK
jgi:hypothetical protein